MSSTEYFSDPDGRFSCCFAKGLLQLNLQGADAFFSLVGEKAEKSVDYLQLLHSGCLSLLGFRRKIVWRDEKMTYQITTLPLEAIRQPYQQKKEDKIKEGLP